MWRRLSSHHQHAVHADLRLPQLAHSSLPFRQHQHSFYRPLIHLPHQRDFCRSITSTSAPTAASHLLSLRSQSLQPPTVHRHSCKLAAAPSQRHSRRIRISSSSSLLHTSALVQHGRHKHQEDEHDEEDDDDDAARTPTTPVEKHAMEVECTRITMIGLWCNIGLALFKFVGGTLGNSIAMISDAVHSLSDLITDGIVIWAARLTNRPPDQNHAYGHGKFESIGSLTVSGTLALTAAGIGWTSIESIQTVMAGGVLPVPTGIALVAAVVSIATKEALYHATLRVANKWNSKLLQANAWHHRSDSVSTLAAMVGVGGAMMHIPVLDPIAGLFVSGLIMKAAIELGWDSIRDLTDENIGAKLQEDVSKILRSMRDEGVLSFHRLRGRNMGPFAMIDVHILVEPTMSVSAAHQIAERARIRVRQKLPIVAEFSVHIDSSPVGAVSKVRSSRDSSYRSVFENAIEEPRLHDQREVQIYTPRHVAEVVNEYRASRAEVNKLKAEVSSATHHHHHASSSTSTAASSSSSLSSPASSSTASSASKLASSVRSFIDSTTSSATSAASTTTSSSPSSSPRPHMDLSTLMRPQSLIERDVRRILSDPVATYTPYVRGLSHFTCHWDQAKKHLRVDLDLVFQSESLSISQAMRVAKEIESAVMKQVPDIHAVDIHLELTDDHISAVCKACESVNSKTTAKPHPHHGHHDE